MQDTMGGIIHHVGRTVRWLAFAAALSSVGGAQAAAPYLYGVSLAVYVDGESQCLSGLFNEQGTMSSDQIDITVTGGDSPVLSGDQKAINIGMECSTDCPDPSVGFRLVSAAFLGRSVYFKHWTYSGATPCYSLSYTYDGEASPLIELHLTSTPVPPRDPMALRWVPEVDRRSGANLLWGPAYLAAQRTICDPNDERYPALLYSGEAFEKQIDLAVAGRGLDLVWGRVHRTLVPGQPELGGVWTHSFDVTATLVWGTHRSWDVRAGNGRTARFRWGGTPYEYVDFYADGWDALLREVKSEKVDSHEPYIRFGDGVTWFFEQITDTESWRIKSIIDRFGNTLAFDYDDQQRLATIMDTLGRTYTIAYNGDGTIASFTENAGLGRSVSYGYDAGKLSQVVYPGGASIGYTYDDSGRLATVTDGRGNLALANAYADGKVASQQFGSGPEAGVVTFAYGGLDLELGETAGVTATDARGHVTGHCFNRFNQRTRLLEVEADATYVTRVAWESHILMQAPYISDDVPTMITLPDGQEIAYTYTTWENAAPYWRRLNITRIEHRGSDGSPLKRVDVFEHGLFNFWDIRFGESFVTRHEVYDATNTLLQGQTYAYSDDGRVTLDGINYDGIVPYASAGSPAFSVTGTAARSGLLSASAVGHLAVAATQDALLAVEDVYTLAPLALFSMASSLYTQENTGVLTTGEVLGFGGDLVTANAVQTLDTGPSWGYHDSFGYNQYGQMTEHLHPKNPAPGVGYDRRQDSYTFSDTGYLCTAMVDSAPEGRQLTTVYTPDAVGRVSAIQDPNSAVTDIVWNDLDQVESVERPVPGSGTQRPRTEYEYDGNGNVTHTYDYYFDDADNGIGDAIVETGYEYDIRNRVIAVFRETDAGVSTTEYDYDGNGNVTQVRTPLAVLGTDPDAIVEYEYDGRNLPIRVTRARTVETRIDYDAGGRVIQIVEAVGLPEVRGWAYEYDALGRLGMITNPTGLRTVYTLDGLGRATQIDERGIDDQLLGRTCNLFNLAGRLTDVDVMHRDPYGMDVDRGWSRTNLVYSDAGHLVIHALEESTTHYTYDSAMRLVTVTGPSGDSLDYAYDGNGNAIEVKEHAINTTTNAHVTYATQYVYDRLGRLIEQNILDQVMPPHVSSTTAFSYDSLGRILQTTDGAGHVTRHSYDPLGRRTGTVHDPTGIAAALAYTYDANNRLLSQTDPNGQVTTYTYDSLDRLLSTSYADGGLERVTQYDALGNVLEHVAPGGLVTRTTYDALGRPTTQQFDRLGGRKNPGVTSFAYDELGRLVSAVNDAAAVTRAYDTLGNVIAETTDFGGGDTYIATSEFDNRGLQIAFRPTQDSDNLGYARDAAGRVTSVSMGVSTLASFSYLGSRPIGRDYANGTHTSIGYDPTGRRPAHIDVRDAANTVLDARAYAWDPAYNLSQFQITGGALPESTSTYSYDGLNRVDPASISASWTLDDAGNRTGTAYTMAGADALMHRYSTVNGESWDYDPAGALRTVAHAKWHTYDARGQLVRYTETTAAAMTSLGNLEPIAPGWVTLTGTWQWNTADGGYLEEVSSTTGVLFSRLPAAAPGMSVEYRSTLNPANPDGDATAGEFSGDDYPPKFYTQILLAVDTSHSSEAYYPYAALRIEPDQLALIECDGATVTELDAAAVVSAQDVWYHVSAVFEGGTVTVTRTSPTAGEPIMTLTGVSSVLSGLSGVANTVGFTVGNQGEYHFRNLQYATTPGATAVHVEWAYDALGRQIAKTVYDGTGTVTGQSRYLYDGWQLVQEVAPNTGVITATYVHGPGYIDDIVAQVRNGQTYYHHTDQQYSTMAVTDATGAPVERYTYDPFGSPTIRNGAGTPITATTINNDILYTGRPWDPQLNLYDYRTRHYNPMLGRFTTPDPANDPANLGNPFTYTANNPWAFVDPYGLEGWGPLSVAADVFRFYVMGRTLGGTNVPPQRPHAQVTQDTSESVLEDLGYRLPDPSNSSYAPQLEAELNEATKQAMTKMQTYVGVVALPVGGVAGVAVDLGNAAVSAARGDEGHAFIGAALAGASVAGSLKRVGQAEHDAAALEGAVEKGLRKFSRKPGAFRRGLEEIAGAPPPGAQAHHIFPRELEPQFEAVGVDVWNPKYGTWWDIPEHQAKSHVWNDTWKKWFLEMDKPGVVITPEMVLDKGREMASDAGLAVHF